jgi:hypothetical protein
MPQSFSRNCTVPSPKPPFLAAAIIFFCASSVGRPLNSPESTLMPYSVNGIGCSTQNSSKNPKPPEPAPEASASARARSISASTFASMLAISSTGGIGITTGRIGRPYFVANSWSRSSCAGTAMMAPVP